MKLKTIRRRIKYFFSRVSRLFSFLPLIWRTHDYDYDYALLLFEHQLGRTAKLFEDNDIRNHEARRIRTLLRLMEKTREYEYSMEYQEQMKEKYGANVLDFHFVPSESNPKHTVLKFEYENWDNREEIDKEHTRLADAANRKQQKAQDLVWKYISHNIYTWWD